MHKTTNYFFSADLLRAIAIILVVIIHVFSEYVNSPKNFLDSSWWIANFINSASRMAVPLFVMLSGMLILHQDKSYTITTFLKKRVSKIGLPLLIWPILYFLWRLWLNNKEFSFSSVMHDYLSLSIYYHLYYLYIIAGLYLLTPLFKTFLSAATKETARYIIILTFLFSLSISLMKFFAHIGPNFATIFTVFLPYIPYYLAGDYLRHIRLSKVQTYWALGGLISLSILTALGTYWHMESVGWNSINTVSQYKFDRYFYDYLSITVIPMTILGYLLIQTLSEKTLLLKKLFPHLVIRQLAVSSFGIFLIHPFLLEFSNRILKFSSSTIPVPVWIFLFIKTITILLISYLIVTLCRKIPVIKLIFG